MKLLDASIGETSQMEIIKALTSHYDRYGNFKNVKTRSAGRKNFIDIYLVIPEHITVKKAHQFAAVLKHDISTAMYES